MQLALCKETLREHVICMHMTSPLQTCTLKCDFEPQNAAAVYGQNAPNLSE